MPESCFSHELAFKFHERNQLQNNSVLDKNTYPTIIIKCILFWRYLTAINNEMLNILAGTYYTKVFNLNCLGP